MQIIMDGASVALLLARAKGMLTDEQVKAMTEDRTAAQIDEIIDRLIAAIINNAPEVEN